MKFDTAEALVEQMVGEIQANSTAGDSPHYLIGYLQSMITGLVVKHPVVADEVQRTIEYYAPATNLKETL